MRVHQDDVYVGRLEPGNALTDRVLVALHVLAHERLVAAGLPDDQLRAVGQHITCEARQHLLGRFTTDALIHYGHGQAGPTASQFLSEQGRIGTRLLGGADTLGRGGADGDDDQGFATANGAGGMGQRHLEASDPVRRGTAQRRMYRRGRGYRAQ